MEKYIKKDKYLEYEIIKTNKKKEYYLTCIKDNIVYLKVPEHATLKDIKTFISQQFYLLYYKIHPEERYFVHFKGKKYLLDIIKANIDKVIVKEDRIVIKSINMTSRHLKSVLYKFFTREVEMQITKLIYDAQYDFKEVTIPKIYVKPIKGYLGYNYIDHIKISPIIAKYDSKYIKVLLYHEICHSLIRGHPQKFWDLLNEKLENGQELDNEMCSISYNNDYL